MRKILAIAWKELYTTFRSRNSILLMFATPLVVSTIIGLAFGGNHYYEIFEFAAIPVAVVNLDEGVDLQEALNLPGGIANADALPLDPNDIGFTLGDTHINLGELLAGGSTLNFGNRLAAILLSQPAASSNTPAGGGFDITQLTCSLLDNTDAATLSAGSTLDGTLDATAVADPAMARAAVERGDYKAAVIIPAGFSQQLMPRFTFDSAGNLRSQPSAGFAPVEVYGNGGRSISAYFIHNIAEDVVKHFVRVNVTLSATLEATVNTLLGNLDLNNSDLSLVDLSASMTALQNLDAATIEPLGCLITPGVSNITVAHQPLDPLQEAPFFARIIVPIGASQAVFFSLFTGVFGIYSIYEERRQWTLQRLLVSPTPRIYLLAGKLLGNLVVVFVQLLVLLAALTLIASVIIGVPTFIWGSNLVAIFAVTLALALCVSGLGVFVVGLARTQEQVVLFGPMINITLAVLGGAFAFSLPQWAAQFSLIYWGVDAFTKLASSQTGIAINLLALFAQGIALFLVGAWLFKRRMEL